MIRTAEAELADFAPKLHLWDMFMADAEQVRAACGAIVAEGLPEGVSHQPHGTLSAQDLHEMQAFLDSHGVSPLSKPALAGTLFPARTVVLRGPEGGIVATGFACMTHNAHSWLAGVAWVGLIAVDPAMRGLGLGKTADALANLAAVDELGATGVVEFVATDNAASRAVLSACGLSQVPDRTVVMFTQSATRMTR
jgi:GNAT superfamily N-acetyltransferase